MSEVALYASKPSSSAGRSIPLEAGQYLFLNVGCRRTSRVARDLGTFLPEKRVARLQFSPRILNMCKFIIFKRGIDLPRLGRFNPPHFENQ